MITTAEVHDVLFQQFPDDTVRKTIRAVDRTRTTLWNGEHLSITRGRLQRLGSTIQQVTNAIQQGEDITVYMARSEESWAIIQEEGILNPKAVEEIRAIGRYDQPGFGSLYFRFNPYSTKVAIMYKNGCILGEKEEKHHIVFGTKMRLSGSLEHDFLVVPSVSDPQGINFVVWNVLDCATREVQKMPYVETELYKVGDFVYTLESALKMFPGVQIERVRKSFYGHEERKKRLPDAQTFI